MNGSEVAVEAVVVSHQNEVRKQRFAFVYKGLELGVVGVGPFGQVEGDQSLLALLLLAESECEGVQKMRERIHEFRVEIPR